MKALIAVNKPDAEQLLALRDLLGDRESACEEADAYASEVFGLEAHQPLTQSMDAVTDLIQRRVPGAGWEVHNPGDPCGAVRAYVAVSEGEDVTVTRGDGPTPAWALLVALVSREIG